MCKHENFRYVLIIGMGVTWVVCNDCDSLIGVLKGYQRKLEKDDMEKPKGVIQK